MRMLLVGVTSEEPQSPAADKRLSENGANNWGDIDLRYSLD